MKGIMSLAVVCCVVCSVLLGMDLKARENVVKPKPVSVCGPFPVLQVAPGEAEKSSKPVDQAKYQALLQRTVSFPMSAERSGEFKGDTAVASLNMPALLCLIGEHSQAFEGGQR